MRAVVEKLKSSTFRVKQNGKVIGTCFSIKESDYILTASHVISAPNGITYPELTIEDNNGKEHSFSISSNDKGSDSAILRCSGIDVEGLQLGQYSDVEEGDEIYFCGFPFGSQYHVTHKGMVSAKGLINGRSSIQVDASVNKGNSGGPCVIYSNGTIIVIGIICTRLVGANLTNFLAEKQNLKNGMNTMTTNVAANILEAFLALMNVFHPVLLELDRFINVGFGEAVSIDYIKNKLEVRT